MPNDYIFSWRKLLLNTIFTILLGPPIGGFILWLGMLITAIISGTAFSSKSWIAGIEVLPAMIAGSYFIGMIPAVLAGGLHTFIRTKLPSQNVPGILLSGAISGVLAILICLVMFYLATTPNLSDLASVGAILLLIGALTGAICAYFMYRVENRKLAN